MAHQLHGLLALGACLALVPVACSKMGDRPPWWPEPRPLGPELLCEGKRHPKPGKSSAPPARDLVAIQAVVRSQDAAFHACRGKVLERDPEAMGQMWTRFVIDTQGEVASACLERADIDDHEGGECLLENFRKLRFPTAAREVTVVYPMRFVPVPASDELLEPNLAKGFGPSPEDEPPRLKRFLLDIER